MIVKSKATKDPTTLVYAELSALRFFIFWFAFISHITSFLFFYGDEKKNEKLNTKIQTTIHNVLRSDQPQFRTH